MDGSNEIWIVSVKAMFFHCMVTMIFFFHLVTIGRDSSWTGRIHVAISWELTFFERLHFLGTFTSQEIEIGNIFNYLRLRDLSHKKYWRTLHRQTRSHTILDPSRCFELNFLSVKMITQRELILNFDRFFESIFYFHHCFILKHFAAKNLWLPTTLAYRLTYFVRNPNPKIVVVFIQFSSWDYKPMFVTLPEMFLFV